MRILGKASTSHLVDAKAMLSLSAQLASMGRVSWMIKMFALLKRRDDMTHDEFVKYWLEIHAPIAKSMPGLRKYVCSATLTRPGREPEFDGVAELWFDDFDSMRKSWSSPEGQATTKDTENFAGKPTVIYASEHSSL